MTAAAVIYQAKQQQNSAEAEDTDASADENVVDADFEEVD